MSGGTKADGGKAPVTLYPFDAMTEACQVLHFGALKYAPRNWEKGIATSRLLDSAFRHLIAYANGQDHDQESGLSHLAHLHCCVAFMQRLRKTHPELDDRVKLDPEVLTMILDTLTVGNLTHEHSENAGRIGHHDQSREEPRQAG